MGSDPLSFFIAGESTFKFQSTLPEWAATGIAKIDKAHEPIVQSTLPEWAATAMQDLTEQGQKISIHAARMGSDQVPADYGYYRLYISIHAARMGSDIGIPAAVKPAIYFNPRCPNGQRRARTKV